MIGPEGHEKSDPKENNPSKTKHIFRIIIWKAGVEFFRVESRYVIKGWMEHAYNNTAVVIFFSFYL